MKICYDNLNDVCLTKKGDLRKGNLIYIEKTACQNCGNSYLTYKYNPGNYCDKSCSKMNKFRSNETKIKISLSLEGIKHSEESKKKMSESLKGVGLGRKHTEESKRKIAKSRVGKYGGKNSPHWLGGISCEPYCQDWTKVLKDFIKERDGYKCLNPYCFGNIYRLSVHHIDYNKKNCEPRNLITLCTSCNARANKDREWHEWHESWYNIIIQKRYSYNENK